MTTARNTRRTSKKDEWQAAFLEALTATGNVSESSKEAQVSRMFVYEQRRADQVFAAAWDDALDQASDLLEKEARRRAHDGWDEPVFGSMGTGLGSGEVGTVRKYSDTLLIFLLKGARPEKYRDRHEVTGKDGTPLFKAYAALNPDDV